MSDDFETYDEGFEEAPKKNNTPLIIGIVVLVVLCCCCSSIAGWWLWENGDQLLRDLGISLNIFSVLSLL